MPRRTHDPFRRLRRDNPRLRLRPDTPLPGIEMDVVAGNPPVPITEWRCPAIRAGMSATLAERMLTELTSPGQAVHDATGDPLMAQVVTAMGRRIASSRSRTEPPEPAALVVCGWPPDPRGLDAAIVLGAMRRRLAEGGTLVIYSDPARGAFDLGIAVRAATAAHLSYLQHVMAIWAVIDGDRIEPIDPAWTPVDGSRHHPVHNDVLLFRHGQHG